MQTMKPKRITITNVLKAAFMLLCCAHTLYSVAVAAPLQVTVAPAGAGTISLLQSAPDQATLTATPSEGYVFSGFSGINGTDSSLLLIANFTSQQQNVSLPGTLAVSAGLLASSGAAGGPFTPATFSYILTNTGAASIQWGATAAVSWLAISASGGSLAPGASTQVTVTLTDAAGVLGAGYYTDGLRFSNLTNALGNTVRPVSLIVTNRVGEITFVTNGDSFSPVVTVDSGANVLWSWADGTSSNSPAPVKNYGSSGVRVNRLSVTPWSALKRINLGFDADDGGDPSLERVAAQPVIAVSGLELAAPFLQQWFSSRTQITSLNFDNFANLDTIECYQASALAQVSLHNTPKLSRVCFEECALDALDLSESPALSDLRGAVNPYPGIYFGGTGARMWHICTKDNQLVRSLPPMTQFPRLRELLIWNDNQDGALVTSSPDLTLVLASHNRYTSADFSGGFSTGNGWLDLSDNRLSSLKIGGCPGLIALFAGNNNLATDAVDSILETLDSLGRYSGYLDLQGNAPPSAAGLQHAESLRQRNWELVLATPEASRKIPPLPWFATGNPGGAGRAQVNASLAPTSARSFFQSLQGTSKKRIPAVSAICSALNLSFIRLSGLGIPSDEDGV